MNINNYLLPDRVAELDQDFLSFEIETANPQDLKHIINACNQVERPTHFWDNPFNSTILYACGLTTHFDFNKARSDDIGGASPDIDMDFSALERQSVIDWVIERWGREHVANIMTHGVFKPKSVTDSYFRTIERKPDINEQGDDLNREYNLKNKERWRTIKSKIPKAQYGKEAKLKDILYGNEEKGYAAHPELLENEYADWHQVADYLEGMIRTYGIHAGGIVISDFPISDIIPLWAKDDQELQLNGTKKTINKYITQYDMNEIDELGALKYDFLGIENGSIIKRTCELIAEHHGIDIDIDTISLTDSKTYQLMHHGLLTGVFQMETSGGAKKLIQEIKPTSIQELSDISATYRPGPLTAGLDRVYIDNKNNGYAPSDLPPELAEILKDSHWTLLYQEQVKIIAVQ